MKDRVTLVSCLMETLRETKDDMECEELDGHLIIHHGESKQSGKKRARNGVTIVLAENARAVLGARWKQGETQRKRPRADGGAAAWGRVYSNRVSSIFPR